MRIKWTSIHRVLEANPAAPWIGPGLAERLKREAAIEAAKKRRQMAKSDRAAAWYRRSR
jgi:hypothetical protein